MAIIKTIRFYIFMITANLPYISGGCCMGWSSPVLPMLLNGDYVIKINIEQGSWVVACLPMGAIVGPLFVSFLLDLLGRKWTLLLDMVVHMASWIMLFVATDINLIYSGRLLNGLTMGIIFMSIPVYIAETADEENRNILCSLNELFIGMGYLAAYTTGSFFSYKMTIIYCSVPTVVFLLLFTCAPESPYFLLQKRKREKALNQLKRLRIKSNDAKLNLELNKMQDLLNEYSNRENPLKTMFKDKTLIKEFLLGMGLLWCQQMSGATPIQAYAHHIFAEVSPSISSSLSTISVGVIQLLSSCVTPFIVHKIGVKFPFLLSCFGVSTCLGVVGICEYISAVEHYADIPVWIPCISIVVFMFFYCIGLFSKQLNKKQTWTSSMGINE